MPITSEERAARLPIKGRLMLQGWTLEKARDRKHSSLKLARTARSDGSHASYQILLVELAFRYRNYERILRTEAAC